MLMLELQYFGYLMLRTNSLEKTWMLGKIEGRRRRGWQRIRCPLSKRLLEMVKDGVAWHAAAHGVTKSQTWLSDWKAVLEKAWTLVFRMLLITFSARGMEVRVLEKHLATLCSSKILQTVINRWNVFMRKFQNKAYFASIYHLHKKRDQSLFHYGLKWLGMETPLGGRSYLEFWKKQPRIISPGAQVQVDVGGGGVCVCCV